MRGEITGGVKKLETSGLYSVTTASRYLGISTETLRVLSLKGEVKVHMRVGAHKAARYIREDLDVFKEKIPHLVQKRTKL